MPTRLHADAVLPCDAAFSLHRPGVVDIGDDGRIAWVGPAASAPTLDGAREERYSGLLMPGLINTHCHSPMVLFRGAGEDLPLLRWLEEVLWPREAHLTPEDVYWGMMLASAELLRFGVTTSTEMYFHPEAIADAVEDAGNRAIITPSLITSPLLAKGSWQEQLEQNRALRGSRGDGGGRVEFGLAGHSAYMLPLEALTAIGRAGIEDEALLHIHVAESRGEAKALEEREGRSVPRILADIGFFDASRVLTAHSVWVSDDDLDIYAEYDVAVAHCPQSNSKLASGIAPVSDMLERGIKVGIATDGPASNNDLDLWEEMRLAPLLQRARTLEATTLPARTAIGLATSGGAAALGRDDIGTLEAGRWADIIHLDTDTTAFVPVTAELDLVSHVLWSASSRHVRDVWVAGARVVADDVCLTVDERGAAQEVQKRAERLASV